MKELKRLAQQAVAAVVVAVVAVVGIIPSLVGNGVASAAEVTSRSITMTSSAPGATANYTVQFTTATTGNIQGVVVDFCANDPLPGDTCSTGSGTTLNGFTIGGSPSVTVNSGLTGTWATTNSTAHTLIYSNASGGSVSSGTAISLTINNVTNPTSNNSPAYPATFYARILTYATSGAATSYTSTSIGSPVDSGGDALSTVQSINITAKVFETLSFCVYTGSCGTAPSLTLGDTTTGALSSSNTYVNANAKFDLATNAGSGVSVVMRGTTLCNTVGAACQSGTASSNTITPIPVGSSPTAMNGSTGTEQFGVCVDKNSSAALTIDSYYVDSLANCHGLTTGILSTANTFGFDNANVTGASGSELVHSTGAVPSVTGGGFAFAANIAPTTEAGIYTTSLNMVATSTY